MVNFKGWLENEWLGKNVGLNPHFYKIAVSGQDGVERIRQKKGDQSKSQRNTSKRENLGGESEKEGSDCIVVVHCFLLSQLDLI